MKKRILSFALVMCLVFALVPAVPAAVAVVSNMPIAQTNGFIAPIDNVVPANAIRVSTAAELAAIGGTQSAGNYYVLTNNINLTAEWVPIDNFHGTFDGQGFTINNLFVLSSSNRQYAGLFAQASEHATIKNVGVNIGLLGVSVNYGAGHYGSNAYVGGLIGRNIGAAITNCYSTGMIYASVRGWSWSTNAYAGGLVGYSEGGTIDTSYASSDVSATSEGASFAGGLVGAVNNATVTACYAMGSVAAASHAGGLIGVVTGSVISNSYAMNAVSVSDFHRSYRNTHAGGLIGVLSSGAIIDCYATGVVSSSSTRNTYAGGLIGVCDAGIITIMNSYATGRVSASASVSNTTSHFSHAGGLIGAVHNIVTIISSFATGVVTAEGRYAHAGGILSGRGANSQVTLTNSYYSSQIIIGDSTWSVGTFIAEWAVRGVVSAVDKGFVPEDLQSDFEAPVTRGEFTRLAMNYLKVTLNMTAAQLEAAYTTNSVINFTDTSDPDLQAAGRIGITSGVSGEPDARQFGANILFDREQAAFMLRRVHMIINSGPETVPDQGYNDMDEAQWHPGAINYVIHHGIMQGTEPARGIFSPKRHFTREQSIITFDRMG